MIIKNIISILMFLTFFLQNVTAQNIKLTGREIMVKVDERPDGESRKSTLKMTLINKRGSKRIREILSYSKDYGKDSKSIMYFQKPADVKGTGFLSWEYDDANRDDDRWLYMHALKKVRRISGSSKNDYFMGSDFTYDDMGDRSVDEDEHTLLNEEEIDGVKYWVVESVSKDKDYMYSKVTRWISQDSYIALKIEFYDRIELLIKILTVPDIREQDGFWTIFKMVMDNKQEKHQTILEFSEISYNTDVKDNLFKVSTLERGRIK